MTDERQESSPKAKEGDLSPIGSGRKEVFERRVDEGFTEGAFGRGPWIGIEKVVAVWAMYGPATDRIATFEHYKTETGSMGMSLRRSPIEGEYSAEEFAAFLQEKKVVLSPRVSLQELIDHME